MRGARVSEFCYYESKSKIIFFGGEGPGGGSGWGGVGGGERGGGRVSECFLQRI